MSTVNCQIPAVRLHFTSPQWEEGGSWRACSHQTCMSFERIETEQTVSSNKRYSCPGCLCKSFWVTIRRRGRYLLGVEERHWWPTGCRELTTDWQCPGRQIKKIAVSGQSRASCCLIEYRSISSANILHILSRSRKQIILTSSQNICVALGELFSNPEVNWVICTVDWFLFSLVDRLCQTPASCLQDYWPAGS